MSTVREIWFTRCPVPTATGLAYRLGWLASEFRPDGIEVRTLQETGGPLARHHYDHQLPSLIREGGNLLALPARAQGAPTRLIGLTWIDEGQAILVRPDSGIRSPLHLIGKRLATGLTFDDVRLVEVGNGPRGRNPGGLWEGIDALVAGDVDAVYVKGAAAAEAARRKGAVVGIDLDLLTDRRFRVNNGTPRPITVHEDFLADHFDLLVRFLHQTLRAAAWARSNLEGVQTILQDETRAGAEGVKAAYRDGFHRALAPDLSPERVELFRRQKDFQLLYGFLDRDFDLDGWIDRRPLEAARERLAEEAPAAA